jgi:hypothetical protein
MTVALHEINSATVTDRRYRLSEISALLLRDWPLQSFEHLQHVFPNLSFFRRRLIAQQVRRVIGDHERRVFIGMPSAAQFAHRPAKAEQAFHRGRAKRDQDPGPNDFDLRSEIRQTGLHLLRRGRAIAGTPQRHVWSALQNIRDVNIGAGEAHRLDDLCQQLSGASDERFAARIFIRARRFSDEHEIGVCVAHAENSLRAARGKVWTFCANANLFPQRCEQLMFVWRQTPELSQRAARGAWGTFATTHLLQRAENCFERGRKLCHEFSFQILRATAIPLMLGNELAFI